MGNEVAITVIAVDHASDILGKIADSFGPIGVAAAAAIGIATAALTGAIEKSFDWAESLDKMGDVTGMNTTQLAAWSYTAEKAGVSGDTLTRSMTYLERGLTNAAGGLDTVGKKLWQYGISAYDANNNVKDQSTLMSEIADKYASFGTQQERVNFLTDVFGRQGAQLVDVFDTLAQEGGIDKVQKKVEALGLAIDPTKYENFGRTMNEIGLTITGLANKAVEPMLPGLQKIGDLFRDWLQQPWVIDTVGKIGDGLGKMADKVAELVGGVPGLINQLLPLMQKVEYFWKLLTTPGQEGNAAAMFQKFIEDTFGKIGDFIMDTVGRIDWGGVIAKFTEQSKKVQDSAFNFLKNIDWKKLGDDLIAGIKNINWNQIGLTIHNAFAALFGANKRGGNMMFTVLKQIVTSVDWGALALAVGNGLASLIAGILGGNWDTIKKQWSDNWNQLVAIVTKIKDIIKGKVNDFLNAGKDLIGGLIDGAKAKAQEMINAVTGVINDALQAAKNLLGIHSPSKVFMEIGANVTAGFANGIAGSTSGAKDAIAKVAGGTVASAVSSGSYGGRGGGGLIFNFPNYIGSRQELQAAMRDAVRQMQAEGKLPASA